MHETAHLGQRCLIAARPAATRMRTGGDIPSRSAPSEELLHEGEADPKAGGNGALRAALLITGAENLLSEVKGIGFHPREHHAVLPYIQSRTALEYTLASVLERNVFGALAVGDARERLRQGMIPFQDT